MVACMTLTIKNLTTQLSNNFVRPLISSSLTIKYLAVLKYIYLLFLSLVFINPLVARTDNNEHVYQVYERLKAAIGDTNKQWPTLQIQQNGGQVLAYYRSKNLIVIDQKLIDICHTMGERETDALAFLIGHELTHFYQHLHWQKAEFVGGFLTDRFAFEAHKGEEKEADLYGAFIAYVANYQPMKVVPDLIEAIYKGYNLNAQIKNYPSLTERKMIANEVCNKVDELVQIFESGNYFMAMGEYASAASSYAHILQFVKYKQLYNNLGTALVATAIQIPDGEEFFFQYPLAIHQEIPLRAAEDISRKVVLEQAILNLQTAVRMDAKAFTIQLNLASAYLLSKDYLKANLLIKELFLLSTTAKEKASLHLLKGIAFAQQGRKKDGKRHFEQALQLSREEHIRLIAAYNLNAIKGIFKKRERVSPTSPTAIIKGIDLTYQNDFPYTEVYLKNVFSPSSKIIELHQLPQTLLCQVHSEADNFALLRTNDRNERTTNYLGVGSTVQQIRATFPRSKAKVLANSQGYFLSYPSHKLIFKMVADRVVEWATFEYY